MTSWRNCPGNLSAKLDSSSNLTIISNKLYTSGSIEVSKPILRPQELTFIVNKCDMDMKKCENNPPRAFKQLCSKLKDKKSFYYSALSKIHPTVECPIKVQNYSIETSMLDLTPLTFLPVNGYIWIMTTKVLGEAREVLMCIETSMSNVRSSTRRRGPRIL